MATPKGLGEFGRIARYFRPLAEDFPGALALTDDAAILVPPPGHELIVTTDAIVAGVHFMASDSPGDIARKALRVNLSDLAAKGARPFAYTLTLALSAAYGDDWVDAFAGALAMDQGRYGIALTGGDSVSTGGPVWVSITAFGIVEQGRMVRRSTARPGDAVFVTGTIGDAALGLAVQQRDHGLPAAACAFLVDRYRNPQPRTLLANAIATHAHAAIDVSDGLLADFSHLCAASSVAGTIALADVPLSDAAKALLAVEPQFWDAVAGGGDDYELLFTADPSDAQTLQHAAAAAGISLSQIGQIRSIAAGEGGAVLLGLDGKPFVPAKSGWVHF